VDKPLRPMANRLWLFCLGSGPVLFGFGVSLFALLCPRAKRKSGWGICGSSCLWFWWLCVFVIYRFACSMDIICPCTNAYLAYAHVRTEPLAQLRPHSRKKKYEVSEAQKALLLLPRTEKGSSTSSEEHYANLPEPTHHDVLHEH